MSESTTTEILNPLFRLAIKSGVEVAVKHHIKRGDNLNAQDKSGWSPLSLAVYHNHPNLVELLLAGGANPATKNSEGLTPLEIAEKRAHIECVSLLRAALTFTSNGTQEAVASTKLLDNSLDSTRFDDPTEAAEADDQNNIEDKSAWAEEWESDDFDWEEDTGFERPSNDVALIRDIETTQNDISRFSPTDSSSDWLEVEQGLPKSSISRSKRNQAPPIRDTIRQLYAVAISVGRLSLPDIEKATEDSRPNEKTAVRLVVEQLAEINELEDSTLPLLEDLQSPVFLDKSQKLVLDDAIRLQHVLASGWQDPQQHFVTAFRDKLLTQQEEVELGSSMAEAKQELYRLVSESEVGLAWLQYLGSRAGTEDYDLSKFFIEIPEIDNSLETDDSQDNTSTDSDETETRTERIDALSSTLSNAENMTRDSRFELLNKLNFKPEALVDLQSFAKLNDSNLFDCNIQRYFEAREKMAIHNLRLVFSEARRYIVSGLPLDDIYQAGNIGLLTGVERFDPSLGYKFSTYGLLWIKQQIRRTIANEGQVIRYPVHIIEKLNQARVALKQNFYSDSYASQIDVISKRLECSAERASFLYQLLRNNRTEPLSNEHFDLEDFAPEDLVDEITPESLISEYQDTNEIAALLQTLSEKERLVITRRYGIGRDAEQTLEEVGQELGVTRERIRQIQVKALDKLKKRIDPLRFDRNFLPQATTTTSEQPKPAIVKEEQIAKDQASQEPRTIKQATIDKQDPNAERVFGIALKEILERCVKAGFNVEIENKHHTVQPPINLSRGEMALVRKLMEQGFNSDGKGRFIKPI